MKYTWRHTKAAGTLEPRTVHQTRVHFSVVRGIHHSLPLDRRYYQRYYYLMSTREKTLEKMRNNPNGWSIDTLKALAGHFGVTYRQNGTSHVVFVWSGGRTLPVPFRRPIKAIYIKKFIALLEE